MKKKIKIWTIVILALVIISLILGYFKLGYLKSFRIVFGSFYVLFLPGYIISYAFFTKEIDIIERITLSFALSIAVVPLVVFYLNLLKVKINLVNVSLEILGIIVIALLVYLYRKRKIKRVIKRN